MSTDFAARCALSGRFEPVSESAPASTCLINNTLYDLAGLAPSLPASAQRRWGSGRNKHNVEQHPFGVQVGTPPTWPVDRRHRHACVRYRRDHGVVLAVRSDPGSAAAGT